MGGKLVDRIQASITQNQAVQGEYILKCVYSWSGNQLAIESNVNFEGGSRVMKYIYKYLR